MATKEKDCYVFKMYNKYNIKREIAYGSDQPHPSYDLAEEPLRRLKANENQQTDSSHYLINYDG